MTLTVSFVIPVLNDAARLERCLRAIRANDYPADRVEIVVIDNGSTDESAAVAARHGARVLVSPRPKVGALRNLGVHEATGEVIAFVDADHEIVPTWIKSAVEVLANRDVGAVGARCVPPPDGTKVQRLYDRLRRHTKGQSEVLWLGSGNMSVRRADFDGVGGFDTALDTCEDVDLCRKLRGKGLKVIADSRLGNIHYGDPESLKRVFFSELWRGRDNVRVSLRPPRSWRTVISAVIPVANITALALLTVGVMSGSVLGRQIGLAAGGLFVVQCGLRATVMTFSNRFRDWLPAYAVAAAYESGRAMALISRIGYGKRRKGAVRS
jgi:glycosyltransferase involved in cell wall biosynthesis